jgi:hypothetical protein
MGLENEGSVSRGKEGSICAENPIDQTAKNLIITQKAFEEGNFNSADITNSQVLPTGIPDANYTTMYDIEILFEEFGDSIIIPNYNMIYGIASQCPYSGGEAVYRARAYIAMINDTIEYDDETACLMDGIYREEGSSTKSLQSDIQIIPNPASDLINIKLNNSEAKMCDLSIYNAIGQKIIFKHLDCKHSTYSIDISGLLPGPYSVKVNIDDMAAIIKKLIIIR